MYANYSLIASYSKQAAKPRKAAVSHQMYYLDLSGNALFSSLLLNYVDIVKYFILRYLRSHYTRLENVSQVFFTL